MGRRLQFDTMMRLAVVEVDKAEECGFYDHPVFVDIERLIDNKTL